MSRVQHFFLFLTKLIDLGVQKPLSINFTLQLQFVRHIIVARNIYLAASVPPVARENWILEAQALSNKPYPIGMMVKTTIRRSRLNTH